MDPICPTILILYFVVFTAQPNKIEMESEKIIYFNIGFITYSLYYICLHLRVFRWCGFLCGILAYCDRLGTGSPIYTCTGTARMHKLHTQVAI